MVSYLYRQSCSSSNAAVRRAVRVSIKTAACCRYVAFCPVDIKSANRRRKCAMAAASGVSGVMEGSVMKLAFLWPTPRDPVRSENASLSVRTDLAKADGLMVAELDLAGQALQAVF